MWNRACVRDSHRRSRIEKEWLGVEICKLDQSNHYTKVKRYTEKLWNWAKLTKPHFLVLSRARQERISIGCWEEEMYLADSRRGVYIYAVGEDIWMQITGEGNVDVEVDVDVSRKEEEKVV